MTDMAPRSSGREKNLAVLALGCEQAAFCRVFLFQGADAAHASCITRALHVSASSRYSLRALGYRARLKVVDIDAWEFDKMRAGVWSWFADYPAASDFAPLFSCQTARVGAENPAKFCDPGVQRMIERALDLVATDPQAANDLWARIDRMVTDRAPCIPLLNPRRVEYVSSRVGNYEFNPQLGRSSTSSGCGRCSPATKSANRTLSPRACSVRRLKGRP
jgi:hypothetical protein